MIRPQKTNKRPPKNHKRPLKDGCLTNQSSHLTFLQQSINKTQIAWATPQNLSNGCKRTTKRDSPRQNFSKTPFPLKLNNITHCTHHFNKRIPFPISYSPIFPHPPPSPIAPSCTLKSHFSQPSSLDRNKTCYPKLHHD